MIYNRITPIFNFFKSPQLYPLYKGISYHKYWIRPLSQKLCISTIPLFYYAYSKKVKCDTSYVATAQNSQVVANRTKIQVTTFWQKMVDIFWHIVRFFQLCLIFIPPITMLPLLLFQKTKPFWMDLFVKAVQRAGVVWIKAFQYLSHRRDIIGPQLAEKFVHLRQNAPQHSFQETKKIFKQAYGKQIGQIFQEFDNQPMASGSVGQVYKAMYHGKKVAVKVRHPGIDKHIKRDVNLLFFFSKMFSLISHSFQIPISEDSMKRTLTQQIDFNIEKQNLQIFNKMFEGRKQVKFPFPFSKDTTDSILVQSFAQGVPITHYQKNQHPLNSVIARIGANTFLQMLMKNNFIHADCHGGNIIVQIYEESYNFFSQIWGYLKQKYYQAEQAIVQSTFQNQTLRQFYLQGKKQQAVVRNLLRKYKQKVKVTIIDVGMVISLDEADRMNFISFIRAVIQSNGQKCAQMIYSLSNFQGKKITQGKFKQYYSELSQLFSVINGKPLEELNGMHLLGGMLNIIRNYRMKLDGQFATLLTNMMVLQAMAKDIDPEINILKCAIPYFSYVKDPVPFQKLQKIID